MSNVFFEDNSLFQISCEFYSESHETEIALLINGDNILSFKRNGLLLTTRWNIDELALWLRDFLNNMAEDPYPVDSEGTYAAIKDIHAREFDTDDDDKFDEYYNKLDEWNIRHRWHPASSGAILADIYFQLVGDNVEISWNNQDSEDGVTFTHILGGVSIPKHLFISVVDSFLKTYAEIWFGDL